MLVRYSLRSLDDRGVAEDVVQQALMLLYQSVREGVVINQPKAWMFTVIRRLISQYIRKHQTALHEPLSAIEDFPARVLNETNSGFELSDANKLFSVLTPREKDVIA